MARFYVETQCWQRFPRVLIMHDKTANITRRYVPEERFPVREYRKKNPISFKSVKL